MALTAQQTNFVDKGADFFNSVFSQIPSADAQAVKAELLAKLTADAALPTDNIEQTIGKGLDFIDAGIHLSTNEKAITIGDLVDSTYNALAGGGGFISAIVGLFKIKNALKK